MPTARRLQSRPVPSLGPGRPTAERAAAIDRAVLAAAEEAFEKTGYADARVDEIARAAGVSKGALYGRYPTKHALMQAVVSNCVQRWAGSWDLPVHSAPGDTRARLKHMARMLMEYFYSGQLDLVERLLMGEPPLNDLQRWRHEVGHDLTVRRIADVLLEGSSFASLRPKSAFKVADMLMSMLYGWWRSNQKVRRIEHEEALAFADFAVDVLFDGQNQWSSALPGGADAN